MDLIGKKVRGFKFEHETIAYPSYMNEYVGKKGIITECYEFAPSVRVGFKDGQHFAYPLSEIHKHLVDDFTLRGVKINTKGKTKEVLEAIEKLDSDIKWMISGENPTENDYGSKYLYISNRGRIQHKDDDLFFKEHENKKLSAKKIIKKANEMKKDFRIKSTDAQSIIDIACSYWKTKLADLWSKDIVLGKEIEIKESFYNEMRNACTTEQHKLFDKIFGVQNECPYKDGELIFVRFNTGNWHLKYSNGTLDKNGNAICYLGQSKGGLTSAWNGHTKAPNVKIPE